MTVQDWRNTQGMAQQAYIDKFVDANPDLEWTDTFINGAATMMGEVWIESSRQVTETFFHYNPDCGALP